MPVTMKFIVRKYLPKDRDSMLVTNDLAIAQLETQMGAFPMGMKERWRFQLDWLACDCVEFLVAECEGSVVGMGACADGKTKYRQHVAEMKRLRVQPAYQGNGIGASIMLELEKKAVCTGYAKAVLETFAENKKAHILFKKLGYTKIREHDFLGLAEEVWEKKLQ